MKGGLNKSKTHCPKGHEYNLQNTYINSKRGFRECRVCKREAVRKHKQKKKEKQIEDISYLGEDAIYG